MRLTTELASDAGQTILLLGNYRPALTLARVLHKEGYKVICSVDGCDGGAEHCRYVDELWGHRPLDQDTGGFFRDLRDFLKRRPDIRVVYPVSEEYVRVFADYEHLLPRGPVYAMTPPDLVRACLDKLGLMSLAVLNKVPTAPFEMVDTLSGFVLATERIGLPLVIRPEKSIDRICGKKALVCETFGDIQDVVLELTSNMRPLLLQRKVEGRRHNLYFAAQNGALVRYLHAVILRTDMPDGTGLAVEGETIAPDATLRQHVADMVKALGYTGIGCAQFLVNEHDGSVSFLEINPRIAGNHAVPEAAGLKLSTLAISLAKAPSLPVHALEGKVGLRYVWTAGDISGVKVAFLRGELSVQESFKWLSRAVSAAWHADIHMKWCWHDPLPGICSLFEVLPSLKGTWRQISRWPAAKVAAWHGS